MRELDEVIFAAYSPGLRQTSWLPLSDTVTKVKTGRVGDHRTELPVAIGPEKDTIWREVVDPRTGLASYQALRAALA